jgi:hypothetical protein
MILKEEMGNQFTFRPMTLATPIYLNYSISSTIIVEEVMAKLFTKSRYEKMRLP